MATSVLAPLYSISQKPTSCSRELGPLRGHNDLISFLGQMQIASVDFLPIKWHPALGNLGTGGSASISQAPINIAKSFAFKRLFCDGRNMEECFARLRKEATILNSAYLRSHVNLIRIEAYCCEILKDSEQILPVLVFEKYPLGNLQDFLLSDKSKSVTFGDRLGFCTDIANALAALHNNYIIHGDVKPSNAFVFEEDGKRIVKMADLGDASICDDNETLAFMPKSKPWDPPEYHHRGFPFWQAIRMDIYSFAVNLNLCQEIDDQVIAALPATVTTLAMLKKLNRLQDAAKKSVYSSEEITREQQSKLDSFFTLTLAENPTARSADLQLMLKLLGVDVILEGPYRSTKMRLFEYYEYPHPKFNLAESMLVLSHADRRIRVGIVHELVHQYSASGCSECKNHLSFQIALSYHTGYGQPRNLELSLKWLQRSDRSVNDLEYQINYAKILIAPPFRSRQLNQLRGQFIFAVDHAHEYRMVHGVELSKIKAELTAEVVDIGISFGEAHEITVELKRTLARILNGYGMYNEAADLQESLVKLLKANGDKNSEMKVLGDLSTTYSLQARLQLAERYRSELARFYTENLGEEHMGTLQTLTALAHTQNELGQTTQAKKNLLRVIAVTTRLVGDEHQSTLSAKSILAAVHLKHGQLAEAERLQSQILEIRLKTLGKDHRSTWNSMSNLAVIVSRQGRVDDAEAMELRVLELRREYLGSNHPDTLTTMNNLALTYGKKKQLDKEESMLKQVLDGRKIMIGIEHDDTITTVEGLAINYRNQGRFEEAEHLETHVICIRLEKLGESHPSVLASRTHLMWILHDRGCWQQAEAVQIENIAAGENERGGNDQNVLRCMSALASMYKVQRRLTDSLTLYEQVLKMRIDLLGNSHYDTAKSARDVETVKELFEAQDEEFSDR